MESSPSGKTVLCVDDEETIRSLLQTVLERDGYSCLCAKNGGEALAMAANRQVDAVVLDYWTPDMSADEIILGMRNLRAGMPIILFSGLLEIPASTRAQVSAYVPKGETLTKLLAELRRSLPTSHSPYAAVRKFPRYPMTLPFAVLVTQAGKTAVIRGLSSDIGEGGIGGKMAGEIACDQRVVICLSDSRLQKPLSLQAQVRYHNRDAHGFEFIGVNDADKARVQLLCQKLASA
jgi:CheY-like chemotaxis protein